MAKAIRNNTKTVELGYKEIRFANYKEWQNGRNMAIDDRVFNNKSK